jgi:hypothetical protein
VINMNPVECNPSARRSLEDSPDSFPKLGTFDVGARIQEGTFAEHQVRPDELFLSFRVAKGSRGVEPSECSEDVLGVSVAPLRRIDEFLDRFGELIGSSGIEDEVDGIPGSSLAASGLGVLRQPSSSSLEQLAKHSHRITTAKGSPVYRPNPSITRKWRPTRKCRAVS